MKVAEVVTDEAQKETINEINNSAKTDQEKIAEFMAIKSLEEF